MMGLNGGLHFFGILAPVEQKMSPALFAESWQITDSYMGARMPGFFLIIIALFIINLLFFRKQWRKAIFWLILSCLLMSIADVVFTINEQAPINKFVAELDVNNLSEAQLTTLDKMRLQTLENFDLRNVWATITFALMMFTPFLLPKIDQ